MPPAKPVIAAKDILPFRAPYAPADEGLAAALLAAAGRSADATLLADEDG